LSKDSAARISRSFFVATALLLTMSIGCWEQWSEDWFPQMKWQKPFVPPDGAVPVDAKTAPHAPGDEAAADAIPNPRPMSLDSLENGRLQYARYCATCHGAEGMGDGPVSMTGDIAGPIAGVLPLAGPASIATVRSDGHIYATIRYGRRRMPGYQRIASEDRWDIVNYLRYLNGQKGVGQ
jgi:mono/diheme cytochrome c family protein